MRTCVLPVVKVSHQQFSNVLRHLCQLFEVRNTQQKKALIPDT